MDRLNRLPKSTENTTCQFNSEIYRLVCLYASYLLKCEAVVAAGDNLNQLSFANGDQLADENLGVGSDAWMYMSGIEEEFELKPFYNALRSFM